jgi:hypothetical protein
LTKRPGKRMKELAMRMERLPSSMVIHNHIRDSLFHLLFRKKRS